MEKSLALTLEFYLTLTLLNVSLKGASLDDFVQLAISLFILALALTNIQIAYHAYSILLYVLFVFIGVYLRWVITFIISVSSFWVVRVYAFQGLLRDFFLMQQLPLQVFKGAIRFFFLWIFPILLIANLPVKAFLSYSIVVYLPAVVTGTILSIAISVYLWKRAMQKYTSTGS